MFCPGCGHPLASDPKRYCTYCGFALDKLMDSLTRGGLSSSLRQFDITLGAGLMLLGVIKAALLALALDAPGRDPITVGLLMLGLIFGVLQLFFQLSPRQKGLSLGATLLFLGALAALAATSFVHGFGVLIIAAIAIPMILTWNRLARIFTKLFFDKKGWGIEERRWPVQPPPALAPAQDSVQAEVDTQRMKPVSVAQSRSVTESTTGLLEK